MVTFELSKIMSKWSSILKYGFSPLVQMITGTNYIKSLNLILHIFTVALHTNI